MRQRLNSILIKTTPEKYIKSTDGFLKTVDYETNESTYFLDSKMIEETMISVDKKQSVSFYNTKIDIKV